MMNDLILDVGNSRMKAAVFSSGRMMSQTAWDGPQAPERLIHFAAEWRISRIGIAESGRLEGAWMEAFRAIGDPAPTFLTGASPSPIRNAYGTPGTLGVDRLANAVAAAQLFPGRPALTIDLGTCATYDLVDASGVYLGGLISPGLRMRAKAMHHFTARLPEVDPVEVPRLVGSDTLSCLAAGVHHGLKGELRAIMQELGQQHPGLAVVLTGGDAPRFARALENGIFAHPFLTLLGLHALLLFDPSPTGAAAAR